MLNLGSHAITTAVLAVAQQQTHTNQTLNTYGYSDTGSYRKAYCILKTVDEYNECKLQARVVAIYSGIYHTLLEEWNVGNLTMALANILL